MIFVDYAEDIAQRVAASNPAQVLETAAGTGIVTRRLRDRLAGRRTFDRDRSQCADAGNRARKVPIR